MFDVFGKKHAGDHIDFQSMYAAVDMLGIRGYQMRHFDICKELWKKYVPHTGRASVLQAELLRQAEKLRNEACDNGNANWDGSYARSCDLIGETLKNSLLFNEAEIKKLCGAIEYVKECGEYACRYDHGEIPNDEAEPVLFAYTGNDLYDFIEDAIAEFSIANPRPIPYTEKNFTG